MCINASMKLTRPSSTLVVYTFKTIIFFLFVPPPFIVLRFFCGLPSACWQNERLVAFFILWQWNVRWSHSSVDHLSLSRNLCIIFPFSFQSLLIFFCIKKCKSMSIHRKIHAHASYVWFCRKHWRSLMHLKIYNNRFWLHWSPVVVESWLVHS